MGRSRQVKIEDHEGYKSLKNKFSTRSTINLNDLLKRREEEQKEEKRNNYIIFLGAAIVAAIVFVILIL